MIDRDSLHLNSIKQTISFYFKLYINIILYLIILIQMKQIGYSQNKLEKN